MCGIVGYVGTRSAVDVIIQGLKRLEYRGYDSAGVGLFLGSEFVIRKAEGRLDNVVKVLEQSRDRFATARSGIGHTRWATHGRPTTQNAHPHRAGHVALVANGIIENYQEIRKRIFDRGHRTAS
ncbi:MAG: glutamine--fructose-6-phosphate aminotransferase, partial [Bdellovibrionota bacterium]